MSRRIARTRRAGEGTRALLAETLIGSLHDVTVTYLGEGRPPSFLSLPVVVRYVAETKVAGALITTVRHRLRRPERREMEMLGGDVTRIPDSAS